MTTMVTRAAATRLAVGLATTAVLATAVAGVGTADAVPGMAPHPAAAVHLADWYGTAWSGTLVAPDNGVFVLTHDKGRSPVVLEQRSVKYQKKARVGTPWKRLAIAHRGSGPVWGQWTRLAGFDGKQFRLCRLAPKGKECTSYSGIIVP